MRADATGDVLKLTDVVAVKDISENLLSLRKLANAGFSIYLDDKSLRVYNKTTNKTILEGIYEKPNWVVNFEVIKSNDDLEFEKFSCNARIVSYQELPEQPHTSIQNKELSVSEGEIKVVENAGYVIGRENEKLIDDTIKIDDLESLQNIEEMFITNPLEKKPSNFEKYNEAMLWHVRMGHASLSYLKKLQKVIKFLGKIKFEESILECEICIMAKMEKLPFKETRKRAERPLQVIHTDKMGPIKPTSYPGLKRFIVVFVDDYSRFAIAYSVKSKD